MATFQLSGLASGFDWKSFVESMVSLERAPVSRLQTEKSTNDRKLTALDALGTRLTDLQTAATALKSATLFTGRSASFTTTASNWSSSAAAGTPVGSYSFGIQQLATTSRLTGQSDIGQGLAATDDVSGVTLATMSTAGRVTAGNFTVNGKTVAVALTDSLQDVFDKISTATSGAVTASYSAASDRITLNSGSPIVLGAANDSSNFLSIARLANNDTGTISSSSALGATALNVPLASARLRNGITAVDGSGNGTFSINGVSLSYNVNTDSLSTILSRITNSAAGVTATFDTAGDRVILTNKSTGDTGMAVNESSGGLMDALGLTSGSTLARGKNTLFTVNGGATLSSTSTTLDEAAHGITGLSVTARTETNETVSVSTNTSAMKTAIETFITRFNAVQTYIDDQTRVSSANGKITAALLSSNREIQGWAQSLRSSAFAAVSGVTGSVKRLEDLGIDFTSSTSQLSIKDPTKLENALRDKSADVASFFTTSSTGFNARLDTFFSSTLGLTGTGGSLGSQKANIAASSRSIDSQIEALERRIQQRKEQLEASFIAMEQAQSTIQQMSSQLTSALGQSNSSK